MNLSGNSSSGTKLISFAALPQTVEAFSALPQMALASPFDTAALYVAALCVYPQNPAEALKMIGLLKGPQPMSPYEVQFLSDRMRGKPYLPLSFFQGATPANGYTPSVPYTVAVSENPYSYAEQGYAKLLLQSAGADSPRPIQLRLAKDGKWYLWEQFLLSDIRQPAAADPWA